METDLRDELREEFERQEEWRRRKAQEFPDDTRNLEAAEIYRKLADTVKDVDLAVLSAYRELFEGFANSEEHSEMTRQVGFHLWPDNAEDFCREFISRRAG